MPSFVKEKGFTIACTRKDVEEYIASLDANPNLSFIEHIKAQIKLDDSQGVDLVIEDLDLRNIDLSGGDFSTKEAPDCYSSITFSKVNLPEEKAQIENAIFSGTVFSNIDLSNVHILDTVLNAEKTIFKDEVKISSTQRKSLEEYSRYLAYDINTLEKLDAPKRREAALKDITEKLVSPTLNQLDPQTWTQSASSLLKTSDNKKIKDAISEIFQAKLKEGDFLDNFLLSRDSKELEALIKKDLNAYIKDVTTYINGAQGKKLNKTQTIKTIISKSAKTTALLGKLEEFKASILAKDKSQYLAPRRTSQPKPQLASGLVADIGMSVATRGSAIAGIDLSNSRSSWPNIPKGHSKDREQDLKLKKEGLEILQTSFQVASGLGVAGGLWQGGFGGMLSAIVAGGAGAVSETTFRNLIAQCDTKPDKLDESYEKFNNQFGDKLLEIAMAVKACKKSLGFMTNNEINQMLLEKFMGPSESRMSVQGIHGIMSNVSRVIALNNVNEAYKFIQNAKGKDPKKRIRLGNPVSQIDLESKMINIPNLLIYASSSVTLICAFILVAVFAGPVIAPFMATIGALSGLQLTALGLAATAITTGLGYKIHQGIKHTIAKISVRRKEAKEQRARPIIQETLERSTHTQEATRGVGATTPAIITTQQIRDPQPQAATTEQTRTGTVRNPQGRPKAPASPAPALEEAPTKAPASPQEPEDIFYDAEDGDLPSTAAKPASAEPAKAAQPGTHAGREAGRKQTGTHAGREAKRRQPDASQPKKGSLRRES